MKIFGYELAHLLQILLYKLGLKTFPVDEMYSAFLMGRINANVFYAYLRSGQIESFIKLHNIILDIYENSEMKEEYKSSLTPVVIESVIYILRTNEVKLGFMLNQLTKIINQDLDKKIQKRQGKRNVIKREN